MVENAKSWERLNEVELQLLTLETTYNLTQIDYLTKEVERKIQLIDDEEALTLLE